MSATTIKVILTVFGTSFQPDKFTALVQVSPDKIRLKGLPVRPNAQKLHEYSSWEISTGTQETLFAEEQILSLFQKLSAKEQEAISYIRDNNLEVKLELVVEIVGDQMPGLFFPREILDLLHRYGAEIDIDLYHIAQPESETTIQNNMVNYDEIDLILLRYIYEYRNQKSVSIPFIDRDMQKKFGTEYCRNNGLLGSSLGHRLDKLVSSGLLQKTEFAMGYMITDSGIGLIQTA